MDLVFKMVFNEKFGIDHLGQRGHFSIGDDNIHICAQNS